MRDTCAGGGAYARCTSARGRPQESSVAPRIIRSLKPARSVAGNSPPETGGARRRRGAGADVGRRCDGRGAEYVWASGSKSPDLVDRRFCRRSPDAMAPLKTGAGPAGPGGGVRRDFVPTAAGVPGRALTGVLLLRRRFSADGGRLVGGSVVPSKVVLASLRGFSARRRASRRGGEPRSSTSLTIALRRSSGDGAPSSDGDEKPLP